MNTKAPNPKFVVDASGKRAAVLLSIQDFENLLSAWEEIVDSEDFREARKTSKETVSVSELRYRVTGKK